MKMLKYRYESLMGTVAFMNEGAMMDSISMGEQAIGEGNILSLHELAENLD
jgi:hypothetical protein